jgi:hypothetical protein
LLLVELSLRGHRHRCCLCIWNWNPTGNSDSIGVNNVPIELGIKPED